MGYGCALQYAGQRTGLGDGDKKVRSSLWLTVCSRLPKGMYVNSKLNRSTDGGGANEKGNGFVGVKMATRLNEDGEGSQGRDAN